MSTPRIHGKKSSRRRFVTASDLQSAVANSLARIRFEDGLRWSDVGSVLHKSEDQAAKYADGSATMDFIAYLRGWEVWGSRFTGAVELLIGDAVDPVTPQETQGCVLKAAVALNDALTNGTLSVDEVRAHRSTLESARDALDAQLQRLTPKSVRA